LTSYRLVYRLGMNRTGIPLPHAGGIATDWVLTSA
jgi:hypothetical protein